MKSNGDWVGSSQPWTVGVGSVGLQVVIAGPGSYRLKRWGKDDVE